MNTVKSIDEVYQLPEASYPVLDEGRFYKVYREDDSLTWLCRNGSYGPSSFTFGLLNNNYYPTEFKENAVIGKHVYLVGNGRNITFYATELNQYFDVGTLPVDTVRPILFTDEKELLYICTGHAIFEFNTETKELNKLIEDASLGFERGVAQKVGNLVKIISTEPFGYYVFDLETKQLTNKTDLMEPITGTGIEIMPLDDKLIAISNYWGGERETWIIFPEIDIIGKVSNFFPEGISYTYIYNHNTLSVSVAPQEPRYKTCYISAGNPWRVYPINDIDRLTSMPKCRPAMVDGNVYFLSGSACDGTPLERGLILRPVADSRFFIWSKAYYEKPMQDLLDIEVDAATKAAIENATTQNGYKTTFDVADKSKYYRYVRLIHAGEVLVSLEPMGVDTYAEIVNTTANDGRIKMITHKFVMSTGEYTIGTRIEKEKPHFLNTITIKPDQWFDSGINAEYGICFKMQGRFITYPTTSPIVAAKNGASMYELFGTQNNYITATLDTLKPKEHTLKTSDWTNKYDNYSGNFPRQFYPTWQDCEVRCGNNYPNDIEMKEPYPEFVKDIGYNFFINRCNNAGVAEGDGATMEVHQIMFFYENPDTNTGKHLIAWIKPALDKDGTPCFFDSINQRYLYNLGAGTFEYTELPSVF